MRAAAVINSRVTLSQSMQITPSDSAASASGSWSAAYGPDHLVDGKTAETGEITYWLLPSQTAGWAQVQLDSLYRLDHVRWLNTHNGAAHDRATAAWRLDGSYDGVTFTELSRGTAPFSPDPSWVEIRP